MFSKLLCRAPSTLHLSCSIAWQRCHCAFPVTVCSSSNFLRSSFLRHLPLVFYRGNQDRSFALNKRFVGGKVTGSGNLMSEYSAVYVTVPNIDTGKKIAQSLVESKLAACCNIIPGITSIYRWEGKIEEDSELLMMIKTRSELLESLTERVKTLHPYDVCEVISVPITGGNSEYLKWIGSNTLAS